MLADPQAAKRQDLYNSLLLERDVPALLGGLTVEQYLSRLANSSTSLETEATTPQLALQGLK
jgi:hypothetical protein